MKPTRTQRAWTTWLALPGIVRIGIILIVVMVVLTLWPRPARAGEPGMMVASNGQDTVRLYDTPCVNLAVLGHVTGRYHAQLRKADATVGGHDFIACWIVDGVSAHLMYEDGDQGLIPLTDFKLDQGA